MKGVLAEGPAQQPSSPELRNGASRNWASSKGEGKVALQDQETGAWSQPLSPQAQPLLGGGAPGAVPECWNRTRTWKTRSHCGPTLTGMRCLTCEVGGRTPHRSLVKLL